MAPPTVTAEFEVPKPAFAPLPGPDILSTIDQEVPFHSSVQESVNWVELGKSEPAPPKTKALSLSPADPKSHRGRFKLGEDTPQIEEGSLNILYDPEAATGILDPSISTELNVQGYWNKKRGEVQLKAGHALAHLIPLTEETYDYEVRDATENDLEWAKKRLYYQIHGFKVNKALIKQMYNKHFRRK